VFQVQPDTMLRLFLSMLIMLAVLTISSAKAQTDT
jgi:hypothetical protein